MIKKLSIATLPLPKFRSDKEAAEYFDTHSMAAVWDHLPESQGIKLSTALAKAIRERRIAR